MGVLLLQNSAASFQRELIIKLASLTLEPLLESPVVYFQITVEKENNLWTNEKNTKSARTAHFFFLASSLLGSITLLCSSRPLIPFWTHKKEIINQGKEVLLKYGWFISYFVNKIETIRTPEQLSTSNHFLHN